MNRPNIVVSRHSAMRRKLMGLGGALIVIVGGWLIYELGLNRAGFSRMDSMALQSRLEAENRLLIDEYELRSRVAQSTASKLIADDLRRKNAPITPSGGRSSKPLQGGAVLK